MMTFDPKTVPAFPVITMELLEDDTVLVDGHPVDIGLDEPPTEAGIRAVAARAANQGLNAVRVRATSPDGTHLMVVTDEGHAHALPSPQEQGARRGPSRRLLTAIVAVAVVVAGGAAAAGITYAVVQAQPAPTPTTPPPPPGEGSNLPVVAPPGFSQTALWARGVDPQIAPVLVDENRLALVDDTGALRLVEAGTGRGIWKTSGRVSSQDGVHVSTINGVTVLVNASSNELNVWPVDADPVAPTTYDTSSRAAVTYLGRSPLIDLGDQTAALFTPDGLTRVDIPVTAAPILATNDSVIAANARTIWRIPAAGLAESMRMPQPSGAIGEPRAISAADDQHLVVLWPTEDQSADIAALVDRYSGSITATATVPRRAFDERSDVIHAPTGTTLTIGSLYIDYSAAPAIISLDDLRPSAVEGATVYGLVDSRPATAVRDGAGFTVTPFTDLDTDARNLPDIVTTTAAFMVADKVEDTLLYALPRTQSQEGP